MLTGVPRMTFQCEDSVARPVVVVHQPHFLPWLGYYNKLANADIYLFQDDVQFRRRYYQNRTLIRSPQGQAQWLTVPVHASRTTLLRDVKVASRRWARKARSALRHSYGSAPYFSQYSDEISGALCEEDVFLVDVNERALRATNQLLGISLRLGRTSEIAARGTRTERLVAACRACGSRGYLFGEGGGPKCHSSAQLEAEGITTYFQCFRESFAQEAAALRLAALNVSVIDFLFVHGASATRALLERPWQIGGKA